MDEEIRLSQGELKLTKEDFERSVREGGGGTLEFMSQRRDPVLMARLIAAFANAMAGSILVGISEAASVVGACLAAVAETVDEARKHLDLSVRACVHEVEYDGKPITVVQLPPSEAPSPPTVRFSFVPARLSAQWHRMSSPAS